MEPESIALPLGYSPIIKSYLPAIVLNEVKNKGGPLDDPRILVRDRPTIMEPESIALPLACLPEPTSKGRATPQRYSHSITPTEIFNTKKIPIRDLIILQQDD